MLKRAYLEITNACNLNCPFCTNEKGNSFLSYEEIDLYTTQIKEFTDYIYLHILGEPLLHKDFERILDLLERSLAPLTIISTPADNPTTTVTIPKTKLRTPELSTVLYTFSSIEYPFKY